MVWLPKRGTYEIDRIIPGVGRVRIRTGTKDKRTADRYEPMLDALPLDVIRLMIHPDHPLPLRVVYDAWISGQLRSLPTAESLLPLIPAMRAWLEKPKDPVSDQEYGTRERTIRTLEAMNAKATIGDAKTLVAKMREDYAERGASFNRARFAIQAFLRDTLGLEHRDYLGVAAIRGLPEPPKQQRHPRTVQQAKEIRSALGEHWGPIWWALCCTGMGPKEFWSDGWKVVGDGVEINGQKRPARNRVVPLVCEMPQPSGKPAGLSEALERLGLGVTPRDARRSYARYLDELRIPGYRQDAYMGHGKKGMRELYRWGDIAEWLAGDRSLMVPYLGEQALRVAK